MRFRHRVRRWLLLLTLGAARAAAGQKDCISLRKSQVASILQHFRRSLVGAGTVRSVEELLGTVFRPRSCEASQPLEEAVQAGRRFLKNLGSLGRREQGPWCSHNFDLEWWEARNLTGAMFMPWPYHIQFKRALKQATAAMIACGLQGRFAPTDGTLIALLRYGRIALDIGGFVDHVDKDIDLMFFVRTQAEFYLKLECIVSYLLSRNDKGWSWWCSGALQEPEGAGELWTFKCVLSRRDGGLETFGSSVDVAFFRFFVAGDSLRTARNCSRDHLCPIKQRELGSVKSLWLPLGKCKAYDFELPCPQSPVTILLQSKEHTDDFQGHVALPAVAVERCPFHSGTLRMLHRGLSLRQMLTLREEARRLHFGGWKSFYHFWFHPDGTPRPLPEGPVSADMRGSGKTRFAQTPPPPVKDPVHTFMVRFRGLAQVFAFSALVQPTGRDEGFANGVVQGSGLAAPDVSIEWVLYFRPLVRHAAHAILQLTKSPHYLAALWELKPLEVCMAYFLDTTFRCAEAAVGRHSYVEGLCKSWARQPADVISNKSEARDRSFLQLLWLVATGCNRLPKDNTGSIWKGPFGPWAKSVRQMLPSVEPGLLLTRHVFLASTDQSDLAPLLINTSSLD